MQKAPAWNHRAPCLHKTSLVGNISKLDFQCSPALLRAADWTVCVRALTPDSTTVFYIWGGFRKPRDGTASQHTRDVPLFRVAVPNHRRFPTYRYVSKHAPHARAGQCLPHTLGAAEHTHNHSHTRPHVQRTMPPALISLLEKFPTRRARSNITAAKGLFCIPKEYWAVGPSPSKKKSVRKSSRIFFFFNPRLYQTAKTAWQRRQLFYSKKDPELLTI